MRTHRIKSGRARPPTKLRRKKRQTDDIFEDNDEREAEIGGGTDKTEGEGK